MANKLKIVSTIKNSPISIWLIILIISLIWGYAWVIMKQALQYMGPFTFSAFRFMTGSLTLLLLVVVYKIKPFAKKYVLPIMIVGFLQTSVVFLFVMYALRFVEAGKSSVLLYSMPIWSSLLAVKFLQEKLSKVKWLGLLIGMLGLFTIVGSDLFHAQHVKIIVGELLIIGAAFAWGAANVIYRMKLGHLPKLQVSAYQMLFGTLGIVVAAFFMEKGTSIVWNSASIFYILFTGVLASALCFTVWFVIISMIDMVTATLSTLLVPVFGLVLSWLVLDEALTLSIIIGSLLIVSGIIVSQHSRENIRSDYRVK